MHKFTFRVLCLVALTALIGILSILIYPESQAQDHRVSLEAALKYVKNFRNSPSAPNILGGSFSRDAFDRILSQSGCSGIRFYYAKKDNGEHTIVLVGVDASGNDMENGYIAEESRPCPPYCGAPGTLNR
jgi:hypothetical protein